MEKSAVGQRRLVIRAASQSLENLTWRHGIKIIPTERCSVEKCTTAVAEVVGYTSLLPAARMNSAIVIFIGQCGENE